MIIGVPWWVFMMIAFISLSGYMAFRAMRAENVIEQLFIEKEGKIYIDRIEKERELRRRDQQHLSD